MPKDIRGVHVFSVGTWNGMKFVAEDMVAIARNTNALIAAGTLKPPLKLGHPGAAGQPALGWVENVRADGDRLRADFMRVPDAVVGAIENGLYRQVSVEMSYLEQIGWIMTGVALLGADLPAVRNLEDLQAYMSAHPPAGNTGVGADGVMAVSFSAAAPNITNEGTTMGEEQAYAAERAAIERERAALDEEKRKHSFAMRFSTAMQELEKQVSAQFITPAIRDRIKDVWGQREATWKPGDTLDIPAHLFSEITALYARVPTETMATDAPSDAPENPDAEIARKATIIMSQRGVSYEHAAREVLMTDTALKTRYFGTLNKHIGIAEVSNGR